jgi:Family of unknown function (DUF6508)
MKTLDEAKKKLAQLKYEHAKRIDNLDIRHRLIQLYSQLPVGTNTIDFAGKLLTVHEAIIHFLPDTKYALQAQVASLIEKQAFETNPSRLMFNLEMFGLAEMPEGPYESSIASDKHHIAKQNAASEKMDRIEIPRIYASLPEGETKLLHYGVWYDCEEMIALFAKERADKSHNEPALKEWYDMDIVYDDDVAMLIDLTLTYMISAQYVQTLAKIDPNSTGSIHDNKVFSACLRLASTLEGRIFQSKFNWTEWQDEANELSKDYRKLARMTLPECVKMLYLHVRKEKFWEGHFDSVLLSGQIQIILVKMRQSFRSNALV